MPLTLDTGHPAYSALQNIWPFKEGTGTPEEFIDQSPTVVFGGTPTWAEEASGWGLYLDSGTDYITLGTDSQLLPTGADLTVLARFRRPNGNTDCMPFAVNTSDGAIECSLIAPSTDGNLYVLFGGYSEPNILGETGHTFTGTTLETWVCRFSSYGIKVWRDGTLVSDHSGTLPTRTDSGFDFNIGLRTGNPEAGDQFVDLFAIFDGTLDDATCEDLSANPWDLFVSAGTTSINGSAEIEIAASGSLSFATTTPISGSAAIEVTAVGRLFGGRPWLDVEFMVVQTELSSLAVVFDVVPAPFVLESLWVQFEVVQANPDALDVIFDVIPQALVTSSTDSDVQAPIARVTI
jgi:hypothetical protein